MSTAGRSRRRRLPKDQRNWFGTACAASAILHCLAIILMPRSDTTDTEDLVVRSMMFIRKDVAVPIRAPAVPKITLQKPYNFIEPDTIVSSRVLKIPAVSVTVAARKQISKVEKLKFVDKTKRRPGGKSNNPPRFQELVRSRISESCEKNVSNRVRIMGGRLGKIVVLSVTILPSGELESVDIVESSNLPEVDRASIAAVRLAAPFPGFPSNPGLSRLKMRVPIRFSLGGKSG